MAEQASRQEANNIERLISLFRETKSPFIYHDEINLEYSKENNDLNKDEVLVRYYSNLFTLSDLMIANAVAKLGFGTRELIWKVLQLEIKESPDKVIVTDYAVLKSRLKALTTSAILKRFHFTTQMGIEQSYYSVSPHGYNYLKRICNYKDRYDEYIGITPIDEVVKCLATAAVSLAVTESAVFKEVNADIQWYIKEMRGIHKLYAEAKTITDDTKHYVLIEPIFFKYDIHRMNKKEFSSNLLERIKVIESYIKTRRNKGQPHIIFVCEDLQGLRQAMEMAAIKFEYYINHIYFTTDSVVYNNGLNGSLLRIEQVDNGKPVRFSDQLYTQFI